MNKIFKSTLPKPRIKFQQGLTLVEMLLGLFLGMLLLLGTFQVFTSTREAFRISQGIANLNENARFLLTRLQMLASQAGYTEPTSATADIYPILIRDYIIIWDLEPNRDSMRLAFQNRRPYGVGLPLIDCHGNPLSTTNNQVNTCHIQITGNDLTVKSGDGQTSVLGNGVRFLRIRIGQDTDGDTVINRYAQPWQNAQFPGNDWDHRALYFGVFTAHTIFMGQTNNWEYPFNKAQATIACQEMGARLASSGEVSSTPVRSERCLWVSDSATPINPPKISDIPIAYQNDRSKCIGWGMPACFGLRPIKPFPSPYRMGELNLSGPNIRFAWGPGTLLAGAFPTTVQVTFLLESEDNVRLTPVDQSFPEFNFTANDRRVRRVYTLTVPFKYVIYAIQGNP